MKIKYNHISAYSIRQIATNYVKKVQFIFDYLKSVWEIKFNGREVKQYNTLIGYYRIVTFNDLVLAVEYAKNKGLIPKNFDIEQLKEGKIIQISS